MSDDLLDIEINGKALTGRRGSMIIEAADEAGILIPRFCYHKKLSVAANCRMCLVEVERAPKPLPACATPIMDGMKISTKSPYALKAQKSVMEFLLINHPLDCPICDQGGECELQDVAMGYGRDVSRFNERKRVVKDKNLGPLIATDMTRCIHCTRCVRFGDEVAGLPELGVTGRGENVEIGTYVTRAMESELSGNVIDVCPVGALTSKPFRFKARAWEVKQGDSLSPHDGVGSNLHVHYKGSKVVRVVPRENDEVNEVWLSDRDRFSYEGLYTEDRLRQPMIKQDGVWHETDWETALDFAANGLMSVRDADGANALGALISPSATVEEAYLLQKLLRGLGSNNVDHRLRQCDFDDTGTDVRPPGLGQSLVALEASNVTLLVGTNLRREQPLANHRVRKSVRGGGQILVVNPVDFEFNYEVAQKIITAPSSLIQAVAGIAKALGVESEALEGIEPDEAQRSMAAALSEAPQASVLLGTIAAGHAHAGVLASLCSAIAKASGATLGLVVDGANAAGAWIAGAVPHRGAGRQTISNYGTNVAQMLATPPKGLILLGIEPELDCYDAAAATQMLEQAAFVVQMTTHTSDQMLHSANVLLPTAAFTENEGTLVNMEGRWQGFAPVVAPLGEARPAWKLLRVLGNLTELEGFDFVDVDSVLAELKGTLGESPDAPFVATLPSSLPAVGESLTRIGDVPIYAIDTLVRRAAALQQTPHARGSGLTIHPSLAERIGVSEGGRVKARQNGVSAEFDVHVDVAVAPGGVRLPAGLSSTAAMGASFGPIELEKI